MSQLAWLGHTVPLKKVCDGWAGSLLRKCQVGFTMLGEVCPIGNAPSKMNVGSGGGHQKKKSWGWGRG